MNSGKNIYTPISFPVMKKQQIFISSQPVGHETLCGRCAALTRKFLCCKSLCAGGFVEGEENNLSPKEYTSQKQSDTCELEIKKQSVQVGTKPTLCDNLVRNLLPCKSHSARRQIGRKATQDVSPDKYMSRNKNVTSESKIHTQPLHDGSKQSGQKNFFDTLTRNLLPCKSPSARRHEEKKVSRDFSPNKNESLNVTSDSEMHRQPVHIDTKSSAQKTFCDTLAKKLLRYKSFSKKGPVHDKETPDVSSDSQSSETEIYKTKDTGKTAKSHDHEFKSMMKKLKRVTPMLNKATESSNAYEGGKKECETCAMEKDMYKTMLKNTKVVDLITDHLIETLQKKMLDNVEDVKAERIKVINTEKEPSQNKVEKTISINFDIYSQNTGDHNLKCYLLQLQKAIGELLLQVSFVKSRNLGGEEKYRKFDISLSDIEQLKFEYSNLTNEIIRLFSNPPSNQPKKRDSRISLIKKELNECTKRFGEFLQNARMLKVVMHNENIKPGQCCSRTYPHIHAIVQNRPAALKFAMPFDDFSPHSATRSNMDDKSNKAGKYKNAPDEGTSYNKWPEYLDPQFPHGKEMKDSSNLTLKETKNEDTVSKSMIQEKSFESRPMSKLAAEKDQTSKQTLSSKGLSYNESATKQPTAKGNPSNHSDTKTQEQTSKQTLSSKGLSYKDSATKQPSAKEKPSNHADTKTQKQTSSLSNTISKETPNKNKENNTAKNQPPKNADNGKERVSENSISTTKKEQAKHTDSTAEEQPSKGGDTSSKKQSITYADSAVKELPSKSYDTTDSEQDSTLSNATFKNNPSKHTYTSRNENTSKHAGRNIPKEQLSKNSDNTAATKNEQTNYIDNTKNEQPSIHSSVKTPSIHSDTAAKDLRSLYKLQSKHSKDKDAKSITENKNLSSTPKIKDSSSDSDISADQTESNTSKKKVFNKEQPKNLDQMKVNAKVKKKESETSSSSDFNASLYSKYYRKNMASATRFKIDTKDVYIMETRPPTSQIKTALTTYELLPSTSKTELTVSRHVTGFENKKSLNASLQCVSETHLPINVPADCCKNSKITNGYHDVSDLPFSASLNSLPLDEDDLDHINRFLGKLDKKDNVIVVKGENHSSNKFKLER